MHCNDRPPHWKLIQIQISQNTCKLLDRRTDRLNDQPTTGRTDRRTDQPTDQPTNLPTNYCTDRRTYGQMDGPTTVLTDGRTDRQTDGQAGWQTHGRTDVWMDRRTDGWTDRRTYYTATQVILTHGLQPHALRVITGCANDLQKAMQKTVQRGIKDRLDPSVGMNASQLWTPHCKLI